MRKYFGLIILGFWLLSSCSLPVSPTPTVASPEPALASPQADEPTPQATPQPTLPPPPINLTHQPLYWFGPLPPLSTNAGRPFIGSEDYMALFNPEAPWQKAAGQIQVFKLYGEWVAYQATDAELRQVVADLKQRGLALAVEAGPLNATEACGYGVEGFAGTEEGLRIANRIKSAGGRIDLLALDEPYYYAHFYDGPNACHWPTDKIAGEVHQYVLTMQAEFPNVLVGDTEPLAGNADDSAYIAWLDTYYQVNGYHLAFLHMDVDWSRINWASEVKAIEMYGREAGVPVGIIYTGNSFDASDEAWLGSAGERVKKYELKTGGQPAQVLFQSWNDKPDLVLPETQAYTFTHFINTYFEDKSALGIRRDGAGANIAFEKNAQSSRQVPENPAAMAVDGDAGTLWSAGDGPYQWLEIDLGQEFDIAEFQLIPSQYPAGRTVHRIFVKGSGTGGGFTLLTTLDGETADGVPLVFSPDVPVTGVQIVKIETVTSPSWVAWREIQIISAGN